MRLVKKRLRPTRIREKKMKNKMLIFAISACASVICMSCEKTREVQRYDVVYNYIDFYPGITMNADIVQQKDWVMVRFDDYRSISCSTKMFMDNELLFESEELEWKDTIEMSKYADGEHQLVIITEYNRFSDWYKRDYTRYGMTKIRLKKDGGVSMVDMVELDPRYSFNYIGWDWTGDSVVSAYILTGENYFSRGSNGEIYADKLESEIQMTLEEGWYVEVGCDDKIFDTVYHDLYVGNPVVCKVDELPTGYHDIKMKVHTDGDRYIDVSLPVILDSLYWDWKGQQ